MVFELLNVAEKLMYLFIPELLMWILISKHGSSFKFRFRSVSNYPNLKPFVNTWTVAVVVLLLTIFSQDLFALIFGKTLISWLENMGPNLIWFTIFLGAFDFLGIYNYVLEKKWDKVSWIAVGICVLGLILYFI